MSAGEDKGSQGTRVQMPLAPGSESPAQTSWVELVSTCPKQSKVPQLWKKHSTWSLWGSALPTSRCCEIFPFTSQTHLLLSLLHPHPAPHLQLFQYLSSPDSPSHRQCVLGSIQDFPACIVGLISLVPAWLILDLPSSFLQPSLSLFCYMQPVGASSAPHPPMDFHRCLHSPLH